MSKWKSMQEEWEKKRIRRSRFAQFRNLCREAMEKAVVMEKTPDSDGPWACTADLVSELRKLEESWNDADEDFEEGT